MKSEQIARKVMELVRCQGDGDKNALMRLAIEAKNTGNDELAAHIYAVAHAFFLDDSGGVLKNSEEAVELGMHLSAIHRIANY